MSYLIGVLCLAGATVCGIVIVLPPPDNKANRIMFIALGIFLLGAAVAFK
jgi:hypothetical protein